MRSEQLWTYPGKRLEAIWRWNYQWAQIQESPALEDRFVPPIFFMSVNGRAVSAVVLPYDTPELIPEVDFLLIVHPPSSVGQQMEQILLPFDAIASQLDAYATAEYALPAYKLPTPRVPETLRKRVLRIQG